MEIDRDSLPSRKLPLSVTPNRSRNGFNHKKEEESLVQFAFLKLPPKWDWFNFLNLPPASDWFIFLNAPPQWDWFSFFKLPRKSGDSISISYCVIRIVITFLKNAVVHLTWTKRKPLRQYCLMPIRLFTPIRCFILFLYGRLLRTKFCTDLCLWEVIYFTAWRTRVVLQFKFL